MFNWPTINDLMNTADTLKHFKQERRNNCESTQKENPPHTPSPIIFSINVQHVNALKRHSAGSSSSRSSSQHPKQLKSKQITNN